MAKTPSITMTDATTAPNIPGITYPIYYLVQAPDGTITTHNISVAGGNFTITATQVGRYDFYSVGSVNPGNAVTSIPTVLPLPSGAWWPKFARYQWAIFQSSDLLFGTQFNFLDGYISNANQVAPVQCNTLITNPNQYFTGVHVGNAATFVPLSQFSTSGGGNGILEPVNKIFMGAAGNGTMEIYGITADQFFNIGSGYYSIGSQTYVTDAKGYVYTNSLAAVGTGPSGGSLNASVLPGYKQGGGYGTSTSLYAFDVRDKYSKYFLNLVRPENLAQFDYYIQGVPLIAMYGDLFQQVYSLFYYNNYIYAFILNQTGPAVYSLWRFNPDGTGGTFMNVLNYQGVQTPEFLLIQNGTIYTNGGTQMMQSVPLPAWSPGGNITFGTPYSVNSTFEPPSVCQPSNLQYTYNLKSVDKTKAISGDILNYEINVTNVSVTTLTSMFFVDTLPAGLTYVPNSVLVNGIPESGDPTTGTGVDLGTTIPQGATFTIDFQAKVNGGQSVGTVLPNTGHVNFINPTTTPNAFTEYTNTVNTTVVAGPDFTSANGFLKAVDKVSANVGDTLTYSFNLHNTGTVAANNIVFSDIIPTGTALVANSVTVNGSTVTGANPGSGVSIGTIAANGTATITFQVTVANNSNPLLQNNGNISFSYLSGNQTVNDAAASNTVTTTVGSTANQAVFTGSTKSANPVTAVVGTTITYTIVLNNTGTAGATNVVVDDPIPAGTTFVAGTVIVNGSSLPGVNPTSIPVGAIGIAGVSTVTFEVQVTGNPVPNPMPNIGFITFSDPTGSGKTAQTNNAAVSVTVRGGNLSTSTKSVTPVSAPIGSNVVYTILLTNTGDIPATGIVLTDTLTAGLTFVANSIMVNGISTPGNITTGVSIPPINAGATTQVTFAAQVTGTPTPNPFTNQADYVFVGPNGTTIPGSVTGGILNVTPSGGNLSTTAKTVSNAAPSVGQTITYTLGIPNTGGLAATNVVVTDTLPTGLNYVPGTTKINGAAAPDGPITGINIPSIAAGATDTVTFNVNVTTIPNPNPFLNIANITYQDGNGNTPTIRPSGGSIKVSPPGANLGGTSTKTVDDPNPVVGQVITYTVTVINSGAQAATNIVITDTLPTGLGYISGTTTVGGLPAADGPITGIVIPSLAAGSSIVVTFKVDVLGIPNPNPYVNQVSMAYNDGNGNRPTDIVKGGTTNVSAGGGANLGLSTKTVSNSNPTVGQTITYTLVVQNTGALTATGIVITDTLPAGLTYVTGSTKINGVAAPDGPLTGINILSLAAGAMDTVTFDVNITGIPTPNPYVNSASIKYNDGNGNTKTNTISGGTINVGAGGGANLGTSSKSVSNPNPVVGQTITYTIAAKNSGALPATGIVITDTLPTGLSYVSGSTKINGAAAPDGPATGINIATLAVGATATITFDVNVTGVPTPNPFVNTANIRYNDGNGNTPTIPVSGGTTNVSPSGSSANLGNTTKTVNNGNPAVGSQVIYTVTIPNTGTQAATNVSVYDNLPAGLALVGIPAVSGSSGPISGSLTLSPGLNIGTIAAGGTAVVTFTVAVNTVPNPNPFANKALISYTDSTGTSQFPAVGGQINVGGSGADLGASTKTASTNSPMVGDSVTYAISIPNKGTVPAQNVTLLDVLTTGINLVPGSISVTGASGPVSGALNLTPGLNIGTIAPGATAVVTFIVAVSALPTPNPFLNQAAFSYTDPSGSHNGNVSGGNLNVSAATGSNLSGSAKAGNKTSANVGDTITFTVTIPNTGSLPALNVDILDILPTGLALVPGSTNVTGASGPNTGTITVVPGLNIGSIAAGATAVVTFGVLVNAVPTPSAFVNQAKITYTDANGKPGIATPSSPGIPINPAPGTSANLGNTTKAVNNGNPAIGSQVTYTVTIPNTGTQAAANVSVYDNLPSGLVLVGTPAVSGASGPISGSLTVLPGLNIGTIAAGGTAVVTFVVAVNSVPSPNPFANKALISYTDSTGNNQFPAIGGQINVGGSGADLGTATKTASTNSPLVGDSVTYTISIPNKGTVPAQNVTLLDILTSGINLIGSPLITGATGTPGGVLNIAPGLNIGTIAAGATATVTFVVAISAIPNPNPFLNQVSYSYTDTTGNHNGTVSGGNLNVSKATGSNLSGATKAGNKTSANVGDTITFTVTIPNTGTLPALNVTVLDLLPTGLALVPGSTIVTGSSGPNTGNITVSPGLNIGSVAAGGTAVVTFGVMVNAVPTPSTFVNQAKITYTDANGKPGVTVTPPGPGIPINPARPKLTIVKSSDKANYAVGDTAIFTINAQNTSNGILSNITFTDQLAPSLQFVNGSVVVNGVPQPSANITTGVIIPSLAAGATDIIVFKAIIVKAGTINNQATAKYTFGLPEQQGSDVSNILTIKGNNINLTVTKKADKNFVLLGDTILYSITIANNTTAAASNIILTDVLTTAVSFVTSSFTVNGTVIQNADLTTGVNIGDLLPGATDIITYQVTVTGSPCNSQIVNGVKLAYTYTLPDGTTGQQILMPEGGSISVIDMGISNFKQFSIESNLVIPTQKPDVEAINTATGSIDILHCHVIQTPVNISNESQRLTGYKLIIHGCLNLVIEYTANEATQTVHSASYCIPFSTFVILPADYKLGSKIVTEGIVEDIYFNLLDLRNFFTNTTTLINVKLLSCN